MELHKSHNTVEKIERRGIIKDEDVIKIRAEGDIDIDNDNLPSLDNLLVLGKEE